MFRSVEMISQWANVISFIATASQLVSQMLQLHTAIDKFDIKKTSVFFPCSLILWSTKFRRDACVVLVLWAHKKR